MDFDLTFLEENGIDTKSGIDYTGNKEKYIAALRRFFEGFEDNSRMILDYLDRGDTDNFVIIVHALKSNSKMIGAFILAGLFEKLEHAGKNGNAAYIEEETPNVIEQYRRFAQLLKPLAGSDDAPPGEIGDKEALEIAERLLEALDDFDDEKSKELAGKLLGYPFDAEQAEEMKRAMKYINDFMYDEAAEVIRRISDAVK